MADSAGNREAIREFILDNISESSVGDDEDIFERGLVRSMFVMQLVLFVEQEFGVSITGEDLQFDNFRTIGRIDELVSRKLATV
ncbi:acyl carrier protein [Streptomyces sp. NPDC093261]|uniref:acyl carrier protein n=1 Tax=Streptomyces sp. NPDC093261 TaxID=3366037 RepID=UPI0038218089